MLEVRDTYNNASVCSVLNCFVAAVVAPEQQNALAAFICESFQSREYFSSVAAFGADCLSIGIAQILSGLQEAQLHDAVYGVGQVGHADCYGIVRGVEVLGNCHGGKNQDHHENDSQDFLHYGFLLIFFAR